MNELAWQKRIVRCGPVHFQPLEDELTPVMKYLCGSMLNAGCGDRDMSDWLMANGVTQLVNFDIASSIPDAVIGVLENMPFPDNRFDAILCNAVLEHVEHIEEVMGELARVLAPGGHGVLAVPFLQPYHQCPNDYRRYTAEGLAAIGEKVGLTTVAIKPVHSAAQTIGWIAWEIAQERGPLWRALCWPWIFLWTRLSLKTDQRIMHNANTFQLIVSKQ